MPIRSVRLVLAAATVVMATAALAGPASVCRAGMTLNNGHCCPSGQYWIADAKMPGGGYCGAPYGPLVPLTIPGNNASHKTTPCKALHTC